MGQVKIGSLRDGLVFIFSDNGKCRIKDIVVIVQLVLKNLCDLNIFFIR